MNKKDLHLKAIKVIKEIKYLNIASVCKDRKPWNTPVYTSFDKDLNFYWLSWKENQHSVNIENNENVFVTLYDSTCPEGTGFGVYMEGTAKKITSIPLLTKALTIAYTRSNKKVKAAKLFLTSYPRRAYQFVPKRVWVNGDDLIKKQFVDVRHELDLDLLKKNLG